MPRSVRKTILETRTARLGNPIRRVPYYVKIATGLHLGYYRGVASGSWVARRYRGAGNYATDAFGIANDTLEADGIKVFDFWQAHVRSAALSKGIRSSAPIVMSPSAGYAQSIDCP
jgi:hypothetical protein